MQKINEMGLISTHYVMAKQVGYQRTSIYNGTQKTVCKCNMVFVRIDGDGEPVPIPEHVHSKTTLEGTNGIQEDN